MYGFRETIREMLARALKEYFGMRSGRPFDLMSEGAEKRFSDLQTARLQHTELNSRIDLT